MRSPRPLLTALAASALAVGSLAAWNAAPAAPPTIQAGTYVVDGAHSTVGFRVRHLGISTVNGQFGQFEGRVTVPRANTLAGMGTTATIQATSISTNNERRDNHLRSADFFDVALYPTITFTSTSIRVLPNDRFALTGNLTMHGVTKPVILNGVYTGTATQGTTTKIALNAEGRINRKDFGLTWNRAIEAGGVVVSEEVSLVLEIEADRQPS